MARRRLRARSAGPVGRATTGARPAGAVDGAAASRRAARAVTAAVLGLLLAAGCGTQAPMSVDGYDVSTEEVGLVESLVSRGGGPEVHGGEPVSEVVAQRARTDLALLGVAREAGVTTLDGPRDVLAGMEESNAARARAVQTGGVVYGPVRHGAAEYYERTLTQIRTAALAAMVDAGDDAVAVSERDVQERLEQDPQSWAQAATTYTLTRLAVPAAPVPSGAQGLQGGSLEAVAAGTPGAVLETLTLDHGELEARGWSPQTVQAVAAAAPGAVVGPEPEQGGWVAYRLDAAEVDAQLALERYRQPLTTLLRQERFDALVQERVRAQEVVLR